MRVTGTQFNVRNYSNESLATTLVEGGVQIERRGKLDGLRPGQQAVLENNEIRIRVVNVDEQVAWRHGAFGFTQCRLENIMEELARWYDVDIIIETPELKEKVFYGVIRKYENISTILDMLKKTQNIDYLIEGKKIVIKEVR